MFKKKVSTDVTEQLTDQVSDLLSGTVSITIADPVVIVPLEKVAKVVAVSPKVQEVTKDQSAITIVKDGDRYKLVSIQFNLSEAKVLEEYADRTSINHAFKVTVAKSGVLG